MHWGILDSPRLELLKQLADNLPVTNSYLAGRTALALLFGHRVSYDFDWFTPDIFDADDIYSSLVTSGNVLITEARKGTFHGIVNDIHVTWLHYPNPLLGRAIEVAEIPGLHLASIMDIAIMKLIAVSQRGAKRDFIDLYMICQRGETLNTILKNCPKKFPSTRINFYHIIKSLSYFDDAEREVMPRMKISVRWEEVKRFYLLEQKKLLAGILENPGQREK